MSLPDASAETMGGISGMVLLAGVLCASPQEGLPKGADRVPGPQAFALPSRRGLRTVHACYHGCLGLTEPLGMGSAHGLEEKRC